MKDPFLPNEMRASVDRLSLLGPSWTTQAALCQHPRVHTISPWQVVVNSRSHTACA